MDPYKILGLSPTAPAAELKRAYRLLVVRLHPDKGGDAAAYALLQDAWTLLGDPQRRAAFDAGGPGSSSAQLPEARAAGTTVEHTLEASLEDFYCGREVRLAGKGAAADVGLTVHIERGMLDRQRIRMHGAVPAAPGAEPGDVVVTLRQSPGPHLRGFVRHRDDLLLRRRVPLRDLLCGPVVLDVVHLDGRRLRLRGPRGQVLPCGTVLAVDGEGMPTRDDPWVRGRLLVELVAVWPTAIDPLERKLLEEALPLEDPPSTAGEAEAEMASVAGTEEAVEELELAVVHHHSLGRDIGGHSDLADGAEEDVGLPPGAPPPEGCATQ
jgi:DnaJ-class molecular chaperone